MTAPKILVCTVGGSDAPVVTAVKAGGWNHVVFVCTDDSEAMVTQQVQVSESPAAPSVTRPSIPDQTGLDAASWSTLIVPADDPDRIYAILTERLEQLRATHSQAEVTVDYTGGTKSMSAAAVLAVASRAGMRLQVTSGKRSDLVRVVDGTQQAIGLRTDQIVIDRQIELLRAIWGQYGYQEAADGFAELVTIARNYPSASPDLLARLNFWRRLGLAFAAWDRFDRKQAANELDHPSRNGTPELKRFAELARTLRDRTLQNPDRRDTSPPLVLFDLLRNAERCAARGRHDDAVARCYRLWEWTVQWLLWADFSIDTGNVEPGRVPADIIEDLRPDEKGRFKIGSAKAWELYRGLHPCSGATRFWNAVDAGGKTNAKRYEEFGLIRNASILAHGARPIDQDDSKKILDWTAGFMDMVRAEARRLMQPDDMPQLPAELPEFVASPGRGTTSL